MEEMGREHALERHSATIVKPFLRMRMTPSLHICDSAVSFRMYRMEIDALLVPILTMVSGTLQDEAYKQNIICNHAVLLFVVHDL